MTKENTNKLTKFLINYADICNVLFYDNISKKRVELWVYYEYSDGNAYIGGEEEDFYNLDNLELIDDKVLNFKIK